MKTLIVCAASALIAAAVGGCTYEHHDHRGHPHAGDYCAPAERVVVRYDDYHGRPYHHHHYYGGGYRR